MVENAANFTGTFQPKPSIFEVLAQKSLGDALHPAFQKLALFLATNIPEKFSFLSQYSEETYLFLDFLLQHHYLKHYSSTFAENFYGLKRILRNDKVLSDKEKLLSLLLAVLAPYIKRQIDQKIFTYKLQLAEGGLGSNSTAKLKKALIVSHSAFEITWGILSIINYIKYMSDYSDYQTLNLRLVNSKLICDQNEEQVAFWSLFFKGQLTWSQVSVGLVKNSLIKAFEIVAFFLQFLQAWNSFGSVGQKSIMSLPKVAPPPMHVRSGKFKGKCPVCLKPWVIPTVVPISGYVFCFKCILRHLSESQTCPVTGLPLKTVDLGRLYLD